MSCTGRSSIRSVLTAKDLEAFVDAYKIPEHFPPTLPGPDESAECTHDRIVIYTLSFSSCGVCYPLSAFKVDLLRHFGVHFSQLHPLGFMRVVHFELSCVAVFGEPSVPLFCMFYKLISDGDWCTFAKRKDSVSPPCYSFMPTSTYPKVWKSRFIFVSAAMMLESPPLRDPKAAIEDSVPVLSANEIVQWKRVLENPTRAFTFPEVVLAMGGLSPFYSVWPKAFIGKKEMTLWGLLHGDCRDVKFMGSSKASIKIPNAPSSSRVRDKTPEISAARITPTFNVSPLHATGTSKPSHPEGLVSQSRLAPLFADALQVPYAPKWKITLSTVVGTPETARDFLANAIPPSHKFMNSALRSDLFNDQYSVSLCKGFFRGAGMLQWMDELRRENEGLRIDLKTSQTVAAELRCQVTDAERRLLEEKGAGVMLEQKELVWERERMA
ncbi:hypothetical protein HanPI659440_Chr17g0696531 [Helianthus annuus]|nr:hypothetical protein HanPI659440_Chr17g0696531 [Helianthus annuus]